MTRLILHAKGSSTINAILLFFEDFCEGERFVWLTSTLVELAHELDPMETHRVQEDLERVHQEQNAEDGKHVAEAQEKEVEDEANCAHVFKPKHSLELSEEDRHEHFTKLTVGQRQGPQTQVRGRI